jgi:hypothetical protein
LLTALLKAVSREQKGSKMRKLWADKQKIGKVPVDNAWCDRCCDTAAVLVRGKWHCASCGTTKIEREKALK